MSVYVYRLTLTMHDFLFYATEERGRTYAGNRYVHNYALAYALKLATSTYHDHVQVPHYKEDLSPLNDAGVYVTPAKPVQIATARHTFKLADTRYAVKMEQSSKNFPNFGYVNEITPESRFSTFALSDKERTFPRWIRLGKWLGKAEVEVEMLDFAEKTGAFTTMHPLNALDVPQTPLLFDLINMPPVSLVEHARFEGDYYALQLPDTKTDIALPAGMRYTF